MSDNQNFVNSFLDSIDEAPDSPFPVPESGFVQPDGGAEQSAPFAAGVITGQQNPTITQSAAPQATEAPPAPAANTGAQQSMLDPFEQAFAAAQSQQESRLAEALAAKPAFFSYGKVKETIEDREATFEDLRQKYETDFPELADGKLISWSVSYGKVTKQISNPASDKVYTVKAEIEKSKTFTDGLKKAKTDAEKNPECVVKLFKKAQSKGETVLPSYKDFCLTAKDAELSRKPIVLLPSKDGRIFEIRKNDIGIFTSPVSCVNEFPEIKADFRMLLPKIPSHIFSKVMGFFKSISDTMTFEALVHILYDTEEKEYLIKVPKQKISHAAVDSENSEPYPDRYIHVMDIHSHNIMPAVFSSTDDRDEKETRLYAVAGRFDRTFPEIAVRAGCAGKFIPLAPEDIFDADFFGEYPEEWKESISFSQVPEKPPRRFGLRFKRAFSEGRL